jgi:heme-degrading monooxygenase HmoA
MSTPTTPIVANPDYVTLINVFTVEPKDQDRLVEMLVEATDKVMCDIPGFISANIHKSADGVRVANYAQWRSAADFQAMLKNPRAQAHMAPIGEFASFDAHLYSVIDVHHA